MPKKHDACRGFLPSSNLDAEVLILGSIPSKRSIEAGQYYASRQNQFWHIMGVLFGAGRDIGYKSRLRTLKQNKIAIWDVVHKCERKGSLDSNIQIRTVVPNDIAGFLVSHHRVRKVVFNGRKPEELFKRFVLGNIPEDVLRRLRFVRLPSTSPAHASMDKKTKLALWKRELLSD